MIARVIVALLALSLAPWAWAHKASDSYLVLSAQGSAVTVRWDIALRDIDFALGLDADGNGEITWGELKERRPALVAWALSRLQIRRGGLCTIQFDDLLVDNHTDGAYAVLRFQGNCPARDGLLAVTYRLLFDVDGLHRGLLRLNLDGIDHAAVFSPTSTELRFGGARHSWWNTLAQYGLEGVWHIWKGFDHLLFLLCLLLPSVLLHQGGRWSGAPRLGLALRDVAGVVTAFTAAHSVTLTLATLGLISLPSRWVESVIALSVLLAAANNLWPVIAHKRWMMAFAFGLIHGFGFATVLADLGLAKETLALSLIGFNLGVEVGQLAIVSGFLPLAFVMRNTRLYQRWVFVGGSIVTMLLAGIWLIERAGDIRLLSAY